MSYGVPAAIPITAMSASKAERSAQRGAPMKLGRLSGIGSVNLLVTWFLSLPYGVSPALSADVGSWIRSDLTTVGQRTDHAEDQPGSEVAGAMPDIETRADDHVVEPNDLPFVCHSP